ncbi:helix-turn-helix domain-containing protein [Neobacillus mesonae]|nr:helix-turn-helix domain-containing protein [Neobacillus mesonae]
MLNALLIDDEQPILDNLKEFIAWELLGIKVAGTARSGSEALELSASVNPDLILCDIRMPVMDGLSFIEQYRSLGGEGEILLLTGYQEFEYARLALQQGVREYICKPIDYFELESTIGTLAKQISMRKQKEQQGTAQQQQMARWIRRKWLYEILLGESNDPDPCMQEESTAARLQYTLLLLDAQDYFRNALLWTDEKRKSWNEAVREVLEQQLSSVVSTGEVIQTRDGEWCIVIEHHTFVSVRNSYLENMINGLKDGFSKVSGMEAQLYCGGKAVHYSQLAEAYRDAQRAIMLVDHSEELALTLGKNEPAEEVDWMSRKWSDRLTLAIRQQNKNEIKSILQQIYSSICAEKESHKGKALKYLHYIVVLMLRDMHEMKLLKPEAEERIWNVMIQPLTLREFYELSITLAEACGNELPRRTAGELVASARDYIATRLDKDLGIEEMADQLGICSSYFCQLFKSHFGVTFVEYITRERMESAKALLKETDRSIASIGTAVGYRERRYFSKVFHKYYGMKPSEYRELAAKTM